MHTLPDNIFFEPTPAFVDWVKDQAWLRYRRVIDAGAGQGFLSMVLRSINIETLAIDIHKRETDLADVQIADATKFEYDSNDVLIIARPCHSGWHEMAFKRAHGWGCHDTLYIGLERNIEEDFGDEWEIEKLLEGAGFEGECVWRVYGKKDGKQFTQLTDGTWGEVRDSVNPRTYEPEKRFYNASGGYCTPKPEMFGQTKFKQAAWQGVYVDPSKYESRSERAAENQMSGMPSGTAKGGYGWVGPEGRWYPCGSRDHDEMMENSFGISHQRACALNFIKCYGTHFCHVSTSRSGSDLKTEQAKTLVRIGFNRDDHEIERTLGTISAEEQALVAQAMSKPQVVKGKYRADRPGD